MFETWEGFEEWEGGFHGFGKSLKSVGGCGRVCEGVKNEEGV